MISRQWKGILIKGKENQYIQFLRNTVFKEMETIEGFVSAQILHNEIDEGTEFMIITEWENLEVIKKFAGENLEAAVVEEFVQKIMIRYDRTVRHYEVDYKTPHK